MISGLITTARFGYAAVTGVDALVDRLAQYSVKLALRSHKADTDAGAEMVDLMRSRVPVDTGLLLNGITFEDQDDGSIIVTASAVRGSFDYARAVEFGHQVGRHVVDDSFFAGSSRPRSHRRSRPTHGFHADAEPFFFGSAEQVLEERGTTLDQAITDAADDVDLT